VVKNAVAESELNPKKLKIQLVPNDDARIHANSSAGCENSPTLRGYSSAGAPSCFFDDTQIKVSSDNFEGAVRDYNGENALSWQYVGGGPLLAESHLGPGGDVSEKTPHYAPTSNTSSKNIDSKAKINAARMVHAPALLRVFASIYRFKSCVRAKTDFLPSSVHSFLLVMIEVL
jgi:hypothetical protein